MTRRLLALTAVLALAASVAQAQEPPVQDSDPIPRVPPGFLVTPYAAIDGTPVSLDWGPGSDVLYVADNLGGRILSFRDLGGAAADPPIVFASGFGGPLGVLAADDGSVFVSDSTGTRSGPFGTRNYGRVWRVRDADGDGVGETREVVLHDLPNGRHNTNGMAIGEDGMLYIANGNATDDGILGGSPEAVPWSGAVVRVDPAATGLSLADLEEEDALIATGMRNLFDVAFSPFDPTKLFIPTNGIDDAGGGATPDLEDSDDLLHLTDTDDLRQKKDPVTGELLFDEDGNPIMEPVIDHMGFPSCLWNAAKRGDLDPYDNPNPNVTAAFGACPTDTVTQPVASFGLHVSADGLAFQETDAWGEGFENDLFVAEFGNFFGDEVVGHEVVRVELSEDGERVERVSEFLSDATALDVTFDDDGSMYVAAFGGTILKVQQVADVPQVIDVDINGWQFLPQKLVVPEGTTIRWTNREQVLPSVHNVRAVQAVTPDGVTSGTEMNGPDLPVGSSHEYRFEQPGTWNYTCTIGIHTAVMHGQITVVPTGS